MDTLKKSNHKDSIVNEKKTRLMIEKGHIWIKASTSSSIFIKTQGNGILIVSLKVDII